MFEKISDILNNKPIEKTEEEKTEIDDEIDNKTGLVRTKKEAEEERKKRLDDPTRWREAA